jgi:hypothetical protein
MKLSQLPSSTSTTASTTLQQCTQLSLLSNLHLPPLYSKSITRDIPKPVPFPTSNKEQHANKEQPLHQLAHHNTTSLLNLFPSNQKERKKHKKIKKNKKSRRKRNVAKKVL